MFALASLLITLFFTLQSYPTLTSGHGNKLLTTNQPPNEVESSDETVGNPSELVLAAAIEAEVEPSLAPDPSVEPETQEPELSSVDEPQVNEPEAIPTDEITPTLTPTPSPILTPTIKPLPKPLPTCPPRFFQPNIDLKNPIIFCLDNSGSPQ